MLEWDCQGWSLSPFTIFQAMDYHEQDHLEALAEFAAGAGHEINNPLAIIAGRTQLLLQEIEHPEHRRHLGIIHAQVKRAYDMTADIRFFSRPPQPEIIEFDLFEELNKLVAEQSPLMQEANLAFHVEINPLNKPIIQSDPVLIHLAVGILCNNAREAAQLTGGNVWLRLHCLENNHRENGWQIIVQDDGPGIPEDVVPLMFNPYYSGRQAGRGLGFGLSKAWRIMQLLGGSIRYEPKSTFLLTLPSSSINKPVKFAQ